MTKAKILITGSASLFGKYLTKTLSKKFDLILAYHHTPLDNFFIKCALKIYHLDITLSSQVRQLMTETKPNFVIHLAAVSNIDFCEKNPEIAREINVRGTANICQSLVNSGGHLIFTSSNAVFDGRRPPYKEDDTPNPLNEYGRTKFEAEKLVLSFPITSTIVRLTTLFGWPPKGARDNDLSYYLKQLQEGNKLYLVNELFFNPISAVTAAYAVDQIIHKKHLGIFHVAGNDKITRYSFVRLINQAFNIKTRSQLIPVTSDHFKNLTARPYDATLSINKMRRVLGIYPKPLLEELRLLSKKN